jgi:hypothetical protein
MPPLGASPSAIAAAERRLGFALPSSYRAFLAKHDGWPKIAHGASLLGTQQLLRGTFVAVARMTIEEHITSGEVDPEGAAAAFVPFGLDPTADVIFAWNTRAARGKGDDDELPIAVWLNEIGVVVEGFPAFLELLLEMLTADVIEGEERRARRGGAPWAAPTGAGARVAAPQSAPRLARAPEVEHRKEGRRIACSWTSAAQSFPELGPT